MKKQTGKKSRSFTSRPKARRSVQDDAAAARMKREVARQVSNTTMPLSLTVNGEAKQWTIAPGDLLLDVLRREGYYGVKRGCESGECGACTVLLDGKPVNSCVLFAAQTEGRAVTTVEGVTRPNGELDEVQATLVEHGAVQCGFCTPGAVLSTKALLQEHPQATSEQIGEALSGHLCRCTGYKKMTEAVEALAHHHRESHACKCESEKYAVVGHRVEKKDAAKLAAGRPAFTDDVHIPGMLIGKILPSPHAHARIKRIDVSKAKALPGVHAVLTYKDVPRVPHTTAGQGWPEPSPYDTYLLDNKVRFVGDRVAAVAAESRALAEEALRCIEVEYEVLPPVLDMECAQDAGVVIHDEPDSTGIEDRKRNLAASIHKQLGDVDQGFRESDLVVERTFRTPRQQHTPLEPHVTITYLDSDDRLIIRTSTQIPFHVRRQVAMILEIPVQRIQVIKPRIGGGFGGKQEMLLEDICGALTLATRRPVKIEYTRAEEFYMARSRHPQILNCKLGFKQDGTIVANQLTVLATTGAYGSHSSTVQGNTGSKVLPLYRAPNLKFDCDIVYTNTPVAGAFRGYGCPQGYFAQETTMDEVAEQLGIDPIELRLRNLIRLGDTDELSAQLGEGRKGLPRVMRSVGIVPCIERGMAAIGWKEKRAQPGAAVPQKSGAAALHLKRGVGVALSMQGSGIAGVDWASALIKLNEDGSYMVKTGCADVGAGADTVLAQIAAETLGVTIDKINIVSGDTDHTPFDVGAYASSTTIISGGAVKKTAEKVRALLLEVAARVVKVPSEKLSLRENKIVADDGQSWPLAEIARVITYKEKVQIMETASHFNTDSPPPFCATFAEVEVDTETGRVKVLHLATAVDAGTAINPTLAEGQVEGAVAQGLGYALAEEMVLDENGRMINPNFLDYKIMSAKDMPKLTTILVETEEPLGPYGAKSIGEISINGPAPAIANAIYHAIGVRFRELPIRAEDVLRAIREKEEKPAVRHAVASNRR